MNLIKISQNQGMQKRKFGTQLINLESCYDKNKSVGNRNRTSSSVYNKKPLKKQKNIIESGISFIMPSSSMEIQEILMPSIPKQATSQYESDILLHLIKLEKNKLQISNYFLFQKDVTENMRGILLNWLVEVHIKYKLMPQTLFIAINIIDLYLEKEHVDRNQLQLLGITSIWISAKFQQIYQVPKISNLQYICENSYNRNDILEMEGKILSKLEFNLISINAFTFLEIFSKFAKLEEKDYFFARYLIEVALLHFPMNKFKSSEIAAASVYFIKKIRKYPCWDEVLNLNPEFNEPEIRRCARDICALIQTIDQNENMKNLKKKFCNKQYRQVGKIKIGQKTKE